MAGVRYSKLITPENIATAINELLFLFTTSASSPDGKDHPEGLVRVVGSEASSLVVTIRLLTQDYY